MKQVEMLAFVFVNTLRLNVEKRLGICHCYRVLEQPGCQVEIGSCFHITPVIEETDIIDGLLQAAQEVDITQPLIAAAGFCNQIRETRIADAMKRRGVTPLVTLKNLSGQSS